MAQRQPEGRADERLGLLRWRPEAHPGGGKLAACRGDPWLILKRVPERQRLCLELCRVLAIPPVKRQQGKLTEHHCLLTTILVRAGMRKSLPQHCLGCCTLPPQAGQDARVAPRRLG